MAELMDMDRIVQSVKAINAAWNNCHFKVWLGLTLIVFLTGCTSQAEAAKSILDPGGNVVKPTATEMTIVPTMTETAPLPTASFTPEPTFTPTVEPTEKPKGLPERWDDPEVMARVQKKFEEKKSVFDVILQKKVVYDLGNTPGTIHGKRNVFLEMRGAGYGPTILDNGVAEIISRAGMLIDRQQIRFNSDLVAEVGYVALLSTETDSSFVIVPFVIGVGTSDGREASVWLTSFQEWDEKAKKGVEFDSLTQLESFLDAKMAEGLPLTVNGFPIMVDNEGHKSAQLLLDEGMPRRNAQNKLVQDFVFQYYSDARYPVFMDYTPDDAGKYSNSELLVQESTKTQLGILVMGCWIEATH